MLALRNLMRSPSFRLTAPAFLAAGFALLACLNSGTPVCAQQYTELSQIKDPPEYAKKKSELFAAGKAADETETKLFDDHFKFVIAEMTLKSNFNKLAAKRDSLKQKDLAPLGRAPTPSFDLHSRLTGFLVTQLPRFIADTGYHPAVRVNWTLILGDLNSTEPGLNGKGDVPLADALPKLQELYVDENQHTAVRLAALVGITRHVKSNASADARKKLAQAMTTILANKKPKESSQESHDFLRRRTLDALRAILEVAPDAADPAIATALANLIADADLRLHYRCEAAAALGALESRNIKKEDVPQMARTLAALAVKITKPEPVAVAAPVLPPAAALQPVGVPPANPPPDAAQPAGAQPAAAPSAGAPPGSPPPAGAPLAGAPPMEVPPAAVPPAAAPPAGEPGAEDAPPAAARGVPRPAVAAAARPNSGRARDTQAYFLTCVKQGFKGPKGNRGLATVPVEPDTKKLVDDLLAKVEEMLKLVSDKKGVPDADLAAQLLPVSEGLQELLKATTAMKAGAGTGTGPVRVPVSNEIKR